MLQRHHQQQQTVLGCSSSSSSSTTSTAAAAAVTTNTTTTTVVVVRGQSVLESAVRTAMEHAFGSPQDVARQQAVLKLDKQASKKKKKKQQDEDTPAIDRDAFLQAAVDAAPSSFDPAVTMATQDAFGDYQCNAALRCGGRPAAQALLEHLVLEESSDKHSDGVFVTPPEIAGPGFLNIRFTTRYLGRAVQAMAAAAQDDLRTVLQQSTTKQRIVVDYSSPNIAKEMHVGHLRSTVIGDCLSNVLEWQGHDVVRLNHVGDWGTQFGMLVEHLRDEYPAALESESSEKIELGDLVTLYKAAKKRFDADQDFKERARNGVVALQAGNPESLAAWQVLCDASRKEFQSIYDMLSIKGLEERGESFYNPFLRSVVDDLAEKGLAVESNGAMAVFMDGYTNRDGDPQPMLVQKTDGGFNYATTDLAAIRHRVETEQADRVLYVTDAGQAQHFDMVFAAADKATYVPGHVSLEHVPFGLVQGADGKKFATRSGDTVKLRDLLDEAVSIAAQDMRERNAEENSIDSVAEIVGIAAVKYADLSMNRESNYRFSYERMLSLNGNTAPYMLYAYARICGIIRKATGQDDGTPVQWPEAADEVVLEHPTEIELARNLVKLPDILAAVERDLYPNRICDYLFETSQKFNQFYENCSVNNAETDSRKASRLSLCTATARTLRLLLNLLGITAVEKL